MTDAVIVETVLACWTHRTDGTIHTSAADQESGWRPTITDTGAA